MGLPAAMDLDVNIVVAIQPVNTVPGSQTTNEDTNEIFPGTISVTDADGHPSLTVDLSVTNGTLTLGSVPGGLTFTDGDGAEDVTMTFSGSEADLNAALNGLFYTPTPDFNGSSVLTITTTDPATLFDTDTVNITVTPVNDAPVLDNTKTPVLASVDEDSGGPSGAVGTAVTSLVSFGGSLSNVTDVDASPITGVAITNLKRTATGISRRMAAAPGPALLARGPLRLITHSCWLHRAAEFISSRTLASAAV